MINEYEKVRMFTKKMFMDEAAEALVKMQEEHKELGIAFMLSSLLVLHGLCEHLFDKNTTEIQA